MKIQVILGSTRPGRVGERVAKWVVAAAEQRSDVEVELVDLADYDLPHFNEPVSPRYNPNRQPSPVVKRWLDKVGQADGYVVVTPEYNHSIPAILKDAIDYLGNQFTKKPVAIVSYGAVGGARAAEHLLTILGVSKAAIVPESITLMGAQSVLDEQGKFTGDTESPYSPAKQLENVLGELVWWTETLKAGREVPAGVK